MKKKELLTCLNFNLILQSAMMTLYEDEGYGGKTLVRLKVRSYERVELLFFLCIQT